MFTLSNSGKERNCSLTTLLFPARWNIWINLESFTSVLHTDDWTFWAMWIFYMFFTLIVGYLAIWSNVELFTLFFTLMQLPAPESCCWWFSQDISWPGFPVFIRHTLVLHHHRWQTLWLKSCPFLITSHHHLLCVLQYKNNHQKGFL